MQREKTDYWKKERDSCEENRLKMADEIKALQGEVRGLKNLIAEQAITQGFILREVIRSPELREQLEKSWARTENVLDEWKAKH